MDARTLCLCKGRAKVIKALEHPIRLFMAEKLLGRAYCVNELAPLVGCEMSNVSKHSSVLRNAGVVQDEKRGAAVYYSLRVPFILNFVKCTDRLLRALKKEEMSLA